MGLTGSSDQSEVEKVNPTPSVAESLATGRLDDDSTNSSKKADFIQKRQSKQPEVKAAKCERCPGVDPTESSNQSSSIEVSNHNPTINIQSKGVGSSMSNDAAHNAFASLEDAIKAPA